MSPGVLQSGTLFANRYEIVTCVGQGGMGAVYEVVHRETLRRRALKVLLPSLVSDQDARARFAQEASITAGIDSEHLVETFDAGVDRDSGCPFIVMELLRGETLGERLSRKQRHDPADVVEILRQVALVLEQTHRRGIIHRDLKPDNLFLARRDDGTCRVKVLDFGIAKVLERAGLSRNTVNIGTPLYMAPEQLDGSGLAPATDLFALTHIAFELVTGESYWEQEVRTAPSTMVLLKWMERGLPEPPRVRAWRLGLKVGVDFDEWFIKGTAHKARARFASARELVEGFAKAIKLPLLSLDQGHLSLTGLLPAPHLMVSPLAVSGDGITDGTTMPRVLANRSQAGFVTPLPTSARLRKTASPLLLAMGAGFISAVAVGVLLVVFLSASGASSSVAASNAPLERSVTSAVESTTTPSFPVVASEPVPTGPPTASASAPSMTSSAKAKASASPKTPRVRPPSTSRPSSECARNPTRCRD